ncbi:hypothetical protein tb265_26540 [Gemmatimonadetes bacterium T265]|nr:hypothetical protein tb265_26540 [Gemmatimonadetes bacterium T265]
MSSPPAASLLDRLDAATEAGDVDAHQLADTLGLTVGGLRAALARPALLPAECAPALARALGLEAGMLRALRRAASAEPAGRGAAPAADVPRTSTEASSFVAVLGATVAAVAGDDVVTAALRRGVLDVAASAARAAGRVLPPAAYQLRARVARGDFAAPRSDPTSPPGTDSTDATLVDAAAALVRALQRAAPGYDGLFAPLDDAGLDDLLRRHGIAVHALDDLPAGSRAVLTPPFFGRYRLLRAGTATADQRRFTARVALVHLLAGHVGETAPLPSPAPLALARLADLVALADLVPFWQLSDARRRGRLGWRALAEDAARHAAALAGDWDARRAVDRGALRVALFRTHAL